MNRKQIISTNVISYAGLMLLALLLVLISYANTAFLNAPFALFMDEQLTFNEVKRIFNYLESGNFSPVVFVKQYLMDGGANQYGRITYNIDAFTSYLPYKFWGDAGLIFAYRTTHLLMLLVAYILLAKTFVAQKVWQIALVLALIVLPDTVYYATMPKPEPAQLFFIALFFYFHSKNNFKLGWHFVFLGLAIGAKISAAPLIAVVGLYSLWLMFKHNGGIYKNVGPILLSGIGFVIGVIFAVPFLIYTITGPGRGFYLNQYLDWTWRATGHGSDQESINFIEWLKFITLTDYAVITGAILLIFVFVAVFILFKNRRNVFTQHSLIVIFLGVLLNLIIMFSVKRLWGFYLHMGWVLLLSGCFAYLSKTNMSKISRWSVIALLAVFVISGTRNAILQANTLAHREQNTEHIFRIKQRNAIIKYLTNVEVKNIKVITSARIYLLPNTGYSSGLFFGGPLNGLNSWPDYLITEQPLLFCNPDGQQQIDKIICNDIPKIKPYVATEQGDCLSDTCYKLGYINQELKLYIYQKTVHLLP